MLRCRNYFEVFWVATLKTFYELNTHSRGQIRIFAIGLLTSSPSRISEDVDIGTPECQSFVSSVIALTNRVVILCARFGGDHIRNAMHQISIPGSSESAGLREAGRDTSARDPVEAFIPPIESRDVQPWNRRGRIHHVLNLLYQHQL